MTWTETEIKQRIPVWHVLSELWLDTELDTADFERIAEQLKNSPYSKEQLWRICIYEVAPVVSPNLFCVAGVWDGFDPEWLCQRIIRKTNSAKNYLNPSLWRQFSGFLHARYLHAIGWNQLVEHL